MGSKDKKHSNNSMGFIATVIAILFPMIITLIDPEISISIGVTNLGVIFILSSHMIGYYIGEMLRSEEDTQLNTKGTGFAHCGVFIGFLTIIIINIYYQVD
ncbi:MAG: hypothetical protein ACFFC6_10600 [Promethearchaeota archaeon]